MELIAIILQAVDPVKQYANEIKTTTTELNNGITVLIAMATVILGLITWIWNYTVKRSDKTEDNVVKTNETVSNLAIQVTRLVTLMEVVMPQTHENTGKISEIKENCASNHIKKKAS